MQKNSTNLIFNLVLDRYYLPIWYKNRADLFDFRVKGPVIYSIRLLYTYRDVFYSFIRCRNSNKIAPSAAADLMTWKQSAPLHKG